MTLKIPGCAFLADRFLSRAKRVIGPERVTSAAVIRVFHALAVQIVRTCVLFLGVEDQGAETHTEISVESLEVKYFVTQSFIIGAEQKGKRNMSSTWLCSHQWHSREAACE